MIYKELLLCKSEWKRYLLVFLLLGFIAGYFVYSGLGSTTLLFIGAILPGVMIALQTTQTSISAEKSNHTFEKLLTFRRLGDILMVKAAVSFAVSAVVTVLFCGGVGIWLMQTQADMTLSKVCIAMMIALCADYLISTVLVLLYMFIDQIILINICTMGVIMALSGICLGSLNAASPWMYAGICSLGILAVSGLLSVLIYRIPNRTALK